jgi:dTDP-4-dehydrorhamnose reductase
MTPSRVMVVGAGGQLGRVISRAFADRDVVAHTRASLDITSPEAVRMAVAAAGPDAIINCAAFNDVDGAEERPVEALAVNALAVRTLALEAETRQARLVHYSTDFVFDGTATRAYTEIDPPSPRSTYASSKLLGEWFALDVPGAFVLRVESLFGVPRDWTGRRGTLDSIVDRLERGQEVLAFTDRIVSPSYVADVAAATRYLLDNERAPGLYHCVNSGQGTWYEVAEESARLLGVTPRLKPATMEQVPMRAARPRFCALANDKLAAAGFVMPHWRNALERWLNARGQAGDRVSWSPATTRIE